MTHAPEIGMTEEARDKIVATLASVVVMLSGGLIWGADFFPGLFKSIVVVALLLGVLAILRLLNWLFE
jgi:hypothetical protein